MNARAEVLEALAGEPALAEDELLEAVQLGRRDAQSALQALESKGVVVRHSMVGQTFYSVADGIGEADVRQALQGRTATEVAEHLIQGSSMFGDSTEGDLNGSAGELLK